jgi:hypothetical protein
VPQNTLSSIAELGGEETGVFYFAAVLKFQTPMALPGTHIRFALDISDLLAVSDFSAYISGTTYPDSRYFTKLERGLTHPNDLIEILLKENDFRKGWAVHLICDKFQREINRERLPEIYQDSDESYIRNTAFKILQDIDDIKFFDILKYIEHIKVSEAPNNEPVDLLEKYYAGVRMLYGGAAEMTVERSLGIFNGIPDFSETLEKIRVQCAMYRTSDSVQKIISSTYSEMLARARKTL